VDNDDAAGIILGESISIMPYQLVFSEGGKSNLNKSFFESTKFFVYNNDPTADVQYFTVNSNSPVDISDGYAGIPSDLTLSSQSFIGSNTAPGVITLEIDFESAATYSEGLTAMEMYETWFNETITNGGDIYSNGEFLLFSVTPNNINGDDMKGQTADATVLLGNQPYELYALNVEYSPTDLDHSK